MREKNWWYFGVVMTGVLKLMLGTLGFVPGITHAIMGGLAAGFDTVIWSAFWLVYLINTYFLMRFNNWARLFSIVLDLIWVVVYWRAFADIEVPLVVMPLKTLVGLLPFAFVIFLLLPKAKEHYAKV